MTRRGGIAGVAMVADVDTDELGPAQAAQADSELGQASAAAAASSPPPGPPDGFTYHLSLPDAQGAGAGTDIVVGESDVPDGLRPLLDLAADRAQPAG